MNTEKVISGFFFILAMTINFGFVYGDPANIEYHSGYELFAAIVINLIATVLKLGDKTQLGSVLLATSLVADIQLIASSSSPRRPSGPSPSTSRTAWGWRAPSPSSPSPPAPSSPTSSRSRSS